MKKILLKDKSLILINNLYVYSKSECYVLLFFSSLNELLLLHKTGNNNNLYILLKGIF